MPTPIKYIDVSRIQSSPILALSVSSHEPAWAQTLLRLRVNPPDSVNQVLDFFPWRIRRDVPFSSAFLFKIPRHQTLPTGITLKSQLPFPLIHTPKKKVASLPMLLPASAICWLPRKCVHIWAFSFHCSFFPFLLFLCNQTDVMFVYFAPFFSLIFVIFLKIFWF